MIQIEVLAVLEVPGVNMFSSQFTILLSFFISGRTFVAFISYETILNFIKSCIIGVIIWFIMEILNI